MNKKIMMLSFWMVLLLPLQSYAEVSAFQINKIMVWGEDEDECALEGEIKQSVGGFINGSETLRVNGTQWANFADLAADSTTGYNIGTKFTFGTEALSARLNYDFDVELDESMCESLMQGDVITFDGSFTDDLSTVTLTMPKLNHGLIRDGSDYVSVDLTEESFSVTGLDSSTQLGSALEELIDDIAENGGCVSSSANGFLLLLFIALLAIRRKKQIS